jgi:hypothetical protein
MKKILFLFLGVMLTSGCASPVTIAAPTPLTTADILVATPTPLPISAPPTATVTPFVIPDIPALEAAKTYTVQTPDPEKLVEVMFLNLKSYEENVFGGDWDDPVFEAARLNEMSIERLLAEDFKRYYPFGIPNAGRFVESKNEKFDGMYFFISASRIELLKTGAIQFINKEKIRLIDGGKQVFSTFELTAHAIGIDDDEITKWLIEVNYPGYGLLLHTPIKINDEGFYELIPNDFYPMWPDIIDMETNLVSVHDLTGDGKEDIVIYYMSYFAGGMSGSVSIYTWRNNGLYYFDGVRLKGVIPRFGESYRSEYQIADHNQDGRDDILVTWPRFRPFDCAWETQTIYHWNGNERIEEETNTEIPNRPDCYIALALESRDTVEQAHWLEKAKKELSPMHPDLEAFLSLRLAAAYAAQGRIQDSQKQLTALDNIKETGVFLEIIRNASEKFDFNALSVCRELYEQADSSIISDQNFNTEIDGHLAFFSGYPISFSPNPNTVCPYWDLLISQLATESIPGNGDPNIDLAAKGYVLSQAQPVPNQPAAFAGIIDIRQSVLVIMKFQSGFWKIDPVSYLDPLPVSFEIQSYKSPTNEQNLLILLTLADKNQSEDDWYTCKNGKKAYQLMLVSDVAGKLQYEGQRTYRCQNKPPVDLSSESGKAEFVLLVKQCNNCDLINDWHTGPGWYWLENFPDDTLEVENVFEYIDELENQLVQGDMLEQTRQKIENLVDFLPADDPTVTLINQRLRYLLGLSYEFQEKPEQAIALYLSIIRESPNSLWSWLAWTRLKAE